MTCRVFYLLFTFTQLEITAKGSASLTVANIFTKSFIMNLRNNFAQRPRTQTLAGHLLPVLIP